MGSIFNNESLVHATAGATGSVFAMICIYPLDSIKFRMQLDDQELLNKSTLPAILHVINKEGLGALYRGIKPVITTVAISNFIYFYTFQSFKSILPKELISSKTDLILSTAAGIINVLITTPLWVVNYRLKSSKNVYNGLLSGLVDIANAEGFGALWRGLAPSLLLVSNPAIHFTVYESLKRRVTSKSATTYFLLGAISKMVATILTYPIQVAQTRQRISKDANISTAALLLFILKKNGPGALYQGLETKMLESVLSAALMFMTYEKIAQTVFKILLRNNTSK